MENIGAYMTETVFIKSYRDDDSFPVNYEQMCASGDAEMGHFIRQLSPMFAADSDLCALLTDGNCLAQSQRGSLRIYLDAKKRNVIMHITSNLYLLFGDSLRCFLRVSAMADCVIMRPKQNEAREMYISVRKDLA